MLHTQELDTVYRDYILDLYRHPKNKKRLEHPTHTTHHKNTSCGDELSLYLCITDGVITDIGFDGMGCAISQASASLFTEHVKNRHIDEVCQMTTKEVLALLGIDIGINREKCALLAYHAFTRALENKQIS